MESDSPAMIAGEDVFQPLTEKFKPKYLRLIEDKMEGVCVKVKYKSD